MRLKVEVHETRNPGIHPSECFVDVRGVESTLQVIVCRDTVAGGMLEVGAPIGRRDDAVLVELPREACDGSWRVWVDPSLLVETPVVPVPSLRHGVSIPVTVVADGMHPSEVVVRVDCLDGREEEVFVDRTSLREGPRIDVGWPVGRDDARGAVLVQFGREAFSGANAAWVPSGGVEIVDGLPAS